VLSVSPCKYLLIAHCHDRGREVESRRPRHSFQKSYADFIETIEGTKKPRFAPILCLFSSTSMAPISSLLRLSSGFLSGKE